MGEGKWRETVGVGFGTGLNKGKTKTWAVKNENTGEVGGFQTEHWDDHLDAHVTPKPVEAKFSTMMGESKDD